MTLPRVLIITDDDGVVQQVYTGPIKMEVYLLDASTEIGTLCSDYSNTGVGLQVSAKNNELDGVLASYTLVPLVEY